MSSVRTSLFNFLSLVFRATPLPKLLLLEKWHQSPHQDALRQGLAAGRAEAVGLRLRLVQAEKQVASLLATSRELCDFVHRRALDGARQPAPHRGSGSASSGGNSSASGVGGASLFDAGPNPTGQLFDEEDSGLARAALLQARMRKLREDGAAVLRLATDCAAKHAAGRSGGGPPAPAPPGADASAGGGGAEVDALSAAVSSWLKTLRPPCAIDGDESNAGARSAGSD
jgi:hypothetical protein